MAKLEGYNPDHPLASQLQQEVEIRQGSTTARKRPKGPHAGMLSYLLWLWWNVLRHIVAAWRALPEDEKQWWRDNCPPAYRNGYTWFIAYHLGSASGADAFTIGTGPKIGHAIIGGRVPEAKWEVGLCPIKDQHPIGGERIYGKAYVDITRVNSRGHIV